MGTTAPLISHLPAPEPADAARTGWPWTEAPDPLPATMTDGRPWPRVSIVTPSFRQGRFIEETIRSVLLQGYPNLQYIVTDGGSSDQTVAILRKYDAFIDHWVSEKDRGQTHAINKGFERADGEILAYINSDDFYAPDALAAVVSRFVDDPTLDIVHGRCRWVEVDSRPRGHSQFASIGSLGELLDVWHVWWRGRQFTQPEVFWTRRIADKAGPFREELHYVMDYEFWCRLLAAGAKVGHVEQDVACFRFQPVQKTSNRDGVSEEQLKVVRDWLWDASSPIDASTRRRLKGQWLHQCVMQPTLDASVARGEGRALRWLRAAGVLARHPGVLLSPTFRRKWGGQRR